MAYGTLPESERVARKGRRKSDPPAQPPEPAFERVEFQAPPGWTATVDRAAESLGLSRSAYIRMAVHRQMRRDKAEDQEGGE